MTHHIFVYAGDLRQQYLSDMLRELGCDVAIGSAMAPEDHYDVAVLPVSRSMDVWEQRRDQMTHIQLLYGCLVSDECKAWCAHYHIQVVDYMSIDSVAQANAIPTAEGAIAEALQADDRSVAGTRSLVAGYGRCGHVIADRLAAWHSRVTVMDRSEDRREQARLMGYEALSIEEAKEHVGEYDRIFNTIPALVLTGDFLKNVREDVTIIDIASGAGGVDYEYCHTNNIRAGSYPGLPGKYAPKDAARILMKVIKQTLTGLSH